MGQTGRVPTAQGGRMTSASRTRQGTAQQPLIGVGAMTEVKVSDRPMTMQGVTDGQRPEPKGTMARTSLQQLQPVQGSVPCEPYMIHRQAASSGPGRALGFRHS
ncbi:Putative cadmium-transporting ATPase [Durusdinium trenchii]|uniref:Cadmium-transporting ATPase n=1 Tax=Durusdinium trenchii TaxID=1381693 RepID=A0ABP0LCM9_9DINO